MKISDKYKKKLITCLCLIMTVAVGLNLDGCYRMRKESTDQVTQDHYVQDKEAAEVAPATKVCPKCFSEININATKCPHCTSDI